MKESRLIFIDIAKGIGVLLVILGHMPSVIPESIRVWIFGFHMPLFFLISGIFAKPVESKNQLKVVVMKRVRGLLIPYFGISFIFLILDIVSGRIGSDDLYFNIVNIMLGMQGVQWYLYSLFISSILLAALYFITPKNVNIWVVIIVGAAVFFHYLHFTNYFQIGSAFFGLGFYYLGHLIKNKIRYTPIMFLTATVISVFASAIIRASGMQILDMKTNYEIDIVINYVIACCGSYIIIFIAHQLEIAHKRKSNFLVNALSYIGENSIIYFPVTWYIPGFISHIVSRSIVAKMLSYIAAFLAAWILSEIRAHISWQFLWKNSKR